jgi:hypothetical protein
MTWQLGFIIAGIFGMVDGRIGFAVLAVYGLIALLA